MRRFSLVPVVLCGAAILVVGSIPGPALPRQPAFWQWDKLFHFGEFAFFAFLMFRYTINKQEARRAALWTMGLALILGMVDELHQIPIPGRTGSWIDLVADLSGALTGIIVSWRRYAGGISR